MTLLPASLIGGWFYDTFNNRVPFYFGAATALLAAFLMFLFYQRGKRHGTSHS
jgi:predicted MFS family arabinose efflux permease